MTKLNKVKSISALLSVPLILAFIFPTNSNAAAPVINQASTTSFGVLAATTITNTGPTTISGSAGGNIGNSPGAAFTGAGTVTQSGTIHLSDGVSALAQADLVTAFNDAAAPIPTIVASDLAAQILAPGTYKSAAGTFTNSGHLIFDAQGDKNAIFVMQTDSTLITAGSSTMTLLNGAQACNVFWKIGSSATLGTSSSLVGHVYALASITATTGATVQGQLLARTGAVTLDTNIITNDNCLPILPTCSMGIANLHFATGGVGSTTGKLSWTSADAGTYKFVGDPSLYPAPYIYGNLTSTWDGTLVNLVPGLIYPVSVSFSSTCGMTTVASINVSNAAAVVLPTPTATPTVTPSATPTPTPVVTPTPTATPVVTPTPKPTKSKPGTVTGGKLPKTGTPWYTLLLISGGLVLLGGTSLTLKKNSSR